MKTSVLNITTLNLTALAIISLLTLSSCDKTEVPIPGLNEAHKTEANLTKAPVSGSNSDIAPPLMNQNRYAIVSIQHQPGYTANPTPDYIVTLYNNGDVIFQGLNGVTKLGTYKYNVSLDVVNNVQNLLSPVFYKIKDVLTDVPDVPDVITTYQMAEDIAPMTLIDNGQNYPVQLIELRKNVESMIKDQPYVGILNEQVNHIETLTGAN